MEHGGRVHQQFLRPGSAGGRRESPRRSSAASSHGGDSRPVSPASSKSIHSFSSSSTLDSIPCDYSSPPLPLVVAVRECVLRKRPPKSVGPGWGFVLRGTSSEFAEGTKVYTCHIESVNDSGPAKAAGLRVGDQIVSIDGQPLKDLEHSNVVRMFQTREKVSLRILPVQFKMCHHARITRLNGNVLIYMWALTRHLHTLEIIGINLGKKRHPSLADLSFSGMVSLRSLSITHCSVSTLDHIDGLCQLQRLESLCLAYNYLSHEQLEEDCPLASLTLLKRLDLGSNLFDMIPRCITNLLNLEILVMTENNISELPMTLAKLTKLHTLCVDRNLLREVDKTLSLLPWLQKLTLSGNILETEVQAVKLKEYLVAGVEDNPFTTPDATGSVSRTEPSLRRTISVRGHCFRSKQRRRICVLPAAKFGRDFSDPRR